MSEERMMDLKRRVYSAAKDEGARVGMERTMEAFEESTLHIDEYVMEMARYVRDLKAKLRNRMLDLAMEAAEAMERNGMDVVIAHTRKEALDAVVDVVGTGKVIVKSKSMISEEIGLREYLEGMGNEVWETDLGEFLLQLSGGRPSHFVVVSMHVPREGALEVLRRKLGYRGPPDVPRMVAAVRDFLREKMLSAQVGITGANAVAAREGALVQVENESNVKLTGSLPPINVVVTSIDKVVPTLLDAIKIAIVESYMLGGTPPTFIDVVSGPSGTRDIEHRLVRPAQGAKEVHVVLLDNGRSSAAGSLLGETLRCIKCGACQLACPVLTTVGPSWGSGAYMGGIGVLWTAITKGFEEAGPLSYLCAGCGICEEYCPMDIKISDLVWEIKRMASAKLEEELGVADS